MDIDQAYERLQKRLAKMTLPALRALADKTAGTGDHVPWKTLYNLRKGIVTDPGVRTAGRLQRALRA